MLMIVSVFLCLSIIVLDFVEVPDFCIFPTASSGVFAYFIALPTYSGLIAECVKVILKHGIVL